MMIWFEVDYFYIQFKTNLNFHAQNGKMITELKVYMIINEFLPKHSTDLPFEAESGSIHSAPNSKFQDLFRGFTFMI